MLNKITENVEIHQTLPDTPNLTPEQLKKKWDEGNKIIKGHFNQLIDSLNDAEVLNLKENTKIITGQECKTNEIIDGKNVYVKRLNVGNLPNADEKTYEIGLDMDTITVTKIDGIAQSKELKSAVPINIAYNGFLIVGCFIATGGQLKIRSEDDRSKFTGFVNIYYTKNN